MKVSILASTLLSFTSLVLAKSTIREQETSQNILPSDFTPPAVFQNTNLVRTIDLSKSYEKVVVNVVIENLSKQPQAEYYVPFTRSEAERLSGGLEGVEVRDRKESEKGRFEVLGVSVDPSRYVILVMEGE
jgi:oligosaccharyltransferase complex subunit alpha (ribophorin I)